MCGHPARALCIFVMKYQFAAEEEDYALFAGGQLFFGLPGQAAFPARLASEVFLHCAGRLAQEGVGGPYVVYDPLCGLAVHLATMAVLHWELVDTLLCADVEAEVVAVARRNLALLTMAGIEQRMAQLAGMIASYGKASHRLSLARAEKLHNRLRRHLQSHPVRVHAFCASATEPPLSRDSLRRPIDIVFADIPYGRRSSWRLAETQSEARADPIRQMLSALHGILPPHAVVAVASDNRQKVSHEKYERFKQIRAGKRRITLLTPAAGKDARDPE